MHGALSITRNIRAFPNPLYPFHSLNITLKFGAVVLFVHSLSKTSIVTLGNLYAKQLELIVSILENIVFPLELSSESGKKAIISLGWDLSWDLHVGSNNGNRLAKRLSVCSQQVCVVWWLRVVGFWSYSLGIVLN